MTTTGPDEILHHALTRPADGPLLVTLSGGLDSSVLLHALAHDTRANAQGIRAIHVHHGLQPQADEWARHCQEFCDALGITLVVAHVQVDRDTGEGLEAAGRKVRYAAFEHAMQAGEVLVTAHHRDDQAETFLLRALRGSGPDGLAAMRPWRAFAHGWHWRPLLNTPRNVLQSYAHAHAMSWHEDPSNTDTHHDRNFLRTHVLPLLQQRWPHADAALARSALLSADAVDLLEAQDAQALAQSRTLDPRALSVSALQQLPPLRRARVLRRWINELDLPPLPREGIMHIECDLLPARADARALFQWREAVIHRWRDLLHAQRMREPLAADWQIEWDGRQPLPIPGGDTLSLQGADTFPAPMQVRARRGGERLTLPGREHSHALKHLLQEFGIPPWERARLPLLTDAQGQLLAIGDLVYSSSFDAWLREQGARLHWSQAS